MFSSTPDLGQAIGVATTLDPRLCQIGLDRALARRETLETSGMFGPRVVISGDADVQARLLGELGRDPRW